MAISAQGTVLSIESSVADTFLPVGEVTGWSGPDPTFNMLDPTNISDTAKRKGVGLVDYGSMTVDVNINYGDTGQDRVRTQQLARARAKWKLVIPAGTLGSGASSPETTLTFYGYVMRFPVTGRTDSIITGSITISIDGAVTES